jgi:hypothetical protein
LKPTSDGPGTTVYAGHRHGRGSALFFPLALLAVLGAGGCTSDDPNVVGTALVTDQVDTVLVALGVEEISRYSGLIVQNPDVLVNEQEVLYIGEQGGTKSGSIIANYDFSNIFSFQYPPELFTEENIKNVKYSLTKLEFYASSAMGDTAGIGLFYEVRRLAEPFNPAEFETYPVTTPTGIGNPINDDYQEGNIDLVPNLDIWDIPSFVSWIANGEMVGIILTLGPGSYPGLVGFASMELTHYNELADEGVGTLVAPNFVVEFNDGNIENFLIGPVVDTSTFETVPDPPADVDSGFILRTCLRTYPALLFDLSQLPPHAFINRALLSVTNDTTASFGNLEAITVLEWDEVRFSAPYDTTTIDALKDAAAGGSQRYSFRVTGQTSLDPNLNTTIQFDVTQAILRVINQVYAPQTRGFLLSAGENFFPEGLSTSVSPDFYYREFQFMGTAAVDPLQRPQLKITYSVVNDLDEGGK